jgi:uncharacterized membrane protein YkoI
MFPEYLVGRGQQGDRSRASCRPAALAPDIEEDVVMRRTIGMLGVSALMGLVVLAAVEAAGEKVAEKDIPKKVMDAVKARFPGAKITSAEKEKSGGDVIYDIELTHKGRKYEMDINEDGTVVEVEKEVLFQELPKRVAKALRAKFPKATIKVVMEVNKVKGNKEVPDHYEVTIETGGKTREVIVSLDGKSIKGEEGKKE